jgi:hypothetical protein
MQNEKFEELISRQLTATLEPQRGKALAAFQSHLSAEAAAAEHAPIPLARGLAAPVSRRALFLWTAIPSLAAACLAVVIMLQLGGPKSIVAPGTDKLVHVDPVKTASPAVGDGVVVSSVEVTQNQPGAVVINNTTPVREIRQQTLRQTQWVDPTDHAKYTLTEPVEKVNYEQVNPY